MNRVDVPVIQMKLVQQAKHLLTFADNSNNMAYIHTPFRPTLLALCAASALLAGCNEIPGLGPDPRTVAKESEARAVGGACRHAMRGLEDCYALNPKSPKGQVYEGWKEMDQYMREFKVEGTPSVFTQTPAPAARKRTGEDEVETELRGRS